MDGGTITLNPSVSLTLPCQNAANSIKAKSSGLFRLVRMYIVYKQGWKGSKVLR